MDELILKTDTKMRKSSDIKILAFIFAVMSVLFWFVIGDRGLPSYLGAEAVLLLALGWTYMRSAKNGDVTLCFKGDSLDVVYGDGRKYNIKDVDRSFFTLTQTEKQKGHDMGTLSVQSTNFKVQYIMEFSKLKAYIDTHFDGARLKKSIYYLDNDDLDDE